MPIATKSDRASDQCQINYEVKIPSTAHRKSLLLDFRSHVGVDKTSFSSYLGLASMDTNGLQKHRSVISNTEHEARAAAYTI